MKTPQKTADTADCRVKVRLLSVSPKKEPCPAEAGWYNLPVRNGETVAGVLKQFGLDGGGLTVLLNGRHADLNCPVRSGDELYVLLKIMGG